MKKDNMDIREGFTNSTGVGMRVQNIVGNPDFKDQFNLQFSIMYFNNGIHSFVLPSALPDSLKTKLPIFIFGNSDYAGAYNKIKTFFPVANNGASNEWGRGNSASIWQYLIWKKELSSGNYSMLNPYAKEGDLVLFYYANILGNEYIAFVIVHCPQVAYGSLLDSINSDVFKINMIRYYVDPSNVDQFKNQILIMKKSIFGKGQNDYIDPETYITGKTFNTNISDIPVNMEINKYIGLGMWINYDCVNFSWSITVSDTKKITL